MNSYTITTVQTDESIYNISNQFINMDLDRVIELQRERLELDKTIERIVIKGRGVERVVTRFDREKSANQLLTETLKNVFSI